MTAGAEDRVPPVDVETDSVDGVVVVKVDGEVDMAGHDLIAGAFGAAIARKSSGVVLDLRGVTFFGSMGVDTIIGAIKASERSGVALALATEQRVVLRALRMTDLEAKVAVFPTLFEAMASVAARR
ncbi:MULTISPECIES: STAS domain-containing protein [Actinosynnema]|uniref:Anti-sigma factor antagonist n=1 Tax=Actinosynnema pretiosum TaxID=42197 RepID=A0A290Z4S0_9PSEU|nr:STAS domain-containing protein [Actinosynnema pretiosum]ATE54017.1 hypothetical protein CNX65_12535 [Actinosynnema pretiosum]